MAILIGVLSLLSCGVVVRPNVVSQGKYIILRDLYLTREAYYPSDYPYGLSKYEYIGHGSSIIQRVGTVPKGSIVTVERSYLKTDFYAPDTVRFQGKVVFNRALVGFNGDYTHEQFSKWFSKIE